MQHAQKHLLPLLMNRRTDLHREGTVVILRPAEVCFGGWHEHQSPGDNCDSSMLAKGGGLGNGATLQMPLPCVLGEGALATSAPHTQGKRVAV